MTTRDEAYSQLQVVLSDYRTDLDPALIAGISKALLDKLSALKRGDKHVPNRLTLRVQVVKLSELTKEMIRLRKAAGLTQGPAAAAIGRSVSFIVRRESGAVEYTLSDVMSLLQAYGVNDKDTVNRLYKLAREGKPRR